MVVPELGKIGGLLLATVQVKGWPHRHALRLLLEPLQPNPFSGENVRHEVQRASILHSSGRNRGQHFLIRPCVIGKFPAQILSKIHERSFNSRFGRRCANTTCRILRLVTLLSYWENTLSDCFASTLHRIRCQARLLRCERLKTRNTQRKLVLALK